MQLCIAIVIAIVHALTTTVYAAPLYTSIDAQPHLDPKLQELERTQILNRDVEVPHSLYPRLLGREKNPNRQDLEMGPLTGTTTNGESSSMPVHADTSSPPSPPARVSQSHSDHLIGEHYQLPAVPPPAYEPQSRGRVATEPANSVTDLPGHTGNQVASTRPQRQGWVNWASSNLLPQTRGGRRELLVCTAIVAACTGPLLVEAVSNGGRL